MTLQTKTTTKLFIIEEKADGNSSLYLPVPQPNMEAAIRMARLAAKRNPGSTFYVVETADEDAFGALGRIP